MNQILPDFLKKPLFILEMANNHMGDLSHGLRIVREFQAVTADFPEFSFSIKLQHRDDTFFHPDFKERRDLKYIKRFQETKLSKEEFKTLKDAIQDSGFLSMCTPWDEPSVDLMEELEFDVIKIASCSFTDWPLWERVVQSKKPVIASTAAAQTEDIDSVVAFLKHRKRSFAIMHCVGEYPCHRDHLELNQIAFLQTRYNGIPVGFSTHEDPDNLDSIRVAIGLGSALFEKHVAVPTEKYAANLYSASPAQVRSWLDTARDSFKMCGVKDARRTIFAKEVEDIQPLYRGVFARNAIEAGHKITMQDVFCAMPNSPGQLLARHLSKYTEIGLRKNVSPKEPLLLEHLEIRDLRERVKMICDELRQILRDQKVALPADVEMEISHHYGIENFEETGAILIHVINRLYSKILVSMRPGQKYPRHYHRLKDETYHLLYGDLTIDSDGTQTTLKAGDVHSIAKGVSHSFFSRGGALVEEVATTYVPGDSIYEDDAINNNRNRKTLLKFWPDWLES